jgi:hypothetical protein
MKLNSSIRLVLILSLLLTGFLSCTPLKCLDETEAYLKISFFKVSTEKLQAPDSLTVYGLNKASEKIYNKSTGVLQAHLPLNNSAEFSEFIIRINGISDTVKFIYSSFPHLISKECGYSFYHTLDTTRIYSKNEIKGMKVWNGNITNLNEENIRIYY